MSGYPPAAGGQQENPVLKWYQNWAASTPLVTRYTTTGIVSLYLISWVVDLSMPLANIPYYSVMKLEVYRLLLSPLFTGSLFGVLFVVMSFSGMGSRMEQSLGSTGFLMLMLTLSLATNVSFVVVTFILAFVGSPEAMFYSATGFWLILMGLVVIESMNSGQESRRLLFLPINIPIKWYPVALYAFFSLFTGPRLDMAVALGVGYAYTKGYLKRFEPGPGRLSGWEQGCLANLTTKPGYISSGGAMGSGAWLPLNAPAPQGAGGGGGGGGAGFGGMFGGQQQQQAQQQQQDQGSSSSGASGNVFGRGQGGGDKQTAFYGSGQTLGSSSSGGSIWGGGSSAMDPEAARVARLQALEARGLTGGGGGGGHEAAGSASAPSMDEAVAQLQGMGFTLAQSQQALALTGGNVDAAVQHLTS